MAGFYHVYLRPKVGVMTTNRRLAVEKTLSAALGWYRYSANTWIIFTTKDAKKWYAVLSKHAAPGGHVFIARIDMADRNGWMPKTMWAWIKKMRDKFPRVG